MARRVAIVPHTHWDREWYSSFQTFRLRLVDLLDDFLPLLEADMGYVHFLLDGQTAVLDDYLEVRPEAEAVLRRLAMSGRLAMGPWYILMDEFLVSGETIVRNLQMGLERAAAFGGAMEVGYLPDMFGHIAQMPQILRQAGLEHAVVWRGVPAAIDKTGFWWEAPDGSRVRAEYLPAGYGNGAAIPDDAKALVRRVAAHDEELGDRLSPGAPMLWMNGTDHQVPQPWLGRVVAEANEIQSDYRFEVTSLADHLAHAVTEGLPTWRGELRSGARSNLLMGVASNRVDVKQAAARAELALERMTEPLCALFLPADRWPQALLDTAWKLVVRNSAHDSICACSIDEVCDAVLHRFSEAHDIAIGLARRAIDRVAASMAEEGTVVVNPSARARGGVVELHLPGTDAPEGAQVIADHHGMEVDMVVQGRDLGAFLGMVRSQQLTEDTYVNGIEVTEQDDHVQVDFALDSRMRDSLNVDEIKRALYALAGARPDDDFHLRGSNPPSVRVLARIDDVPAYGWRMWAPVPLSVPPVEVSADGLRLANGLVTVAVDPTDGTFSIDGAGGLNRLVDDGDWGDTYNWSPPSADTVVDTPEAVTVRVLLGGPVAGRVEITRRYHWFARVVGDTGGQRREGEVPVDVVTVVELHAGERFVRVATSFTNQCRDHRLRAWFPLPAAAASSRAECAFAVVERGLEAEGGPTEVALPTFPSRRFVSAGGLTLVHEGLLEYEVVDGGRAVALTLLRATGMLSRTEMAYRPLPAGPPVPLEGSQMQGAHTLRYAVHVGHADPYELADDAFLFLSPRHAHGGGGQAPVGSALAVEGAGVQVSAVRRRAGALEVRVFNPTAEPTTVTLEGRRGWLVDLRDRPLAPFDGSFPLGPGQIATARLRP